jgi:hypothetical protein
MSACVCVKRRIQDEECRKAVSQPDLNRELGFDCRMKLCQQMSLLDADFRYVVEFVQKPVAAALRMPFVHRGQFVLCGFEHGSSWRLRRDSLPRIPGSKSLSTLRSFRSARRAFDVQGTADSGFALPYESNCAGGCRKQLRFSV